MLVLVPASVSTSARFTKKKTKRREQVAMSYVAVDGDVSAAVEVSETAS